MNITYLLAGATLASLILIVGNLAILNRKWAAGFAATFLLCLTAAAQTNVAVATNAVVGPVAVAGPSADLNNLIIAMIAVLVPLAVAGIKKMMPNIPSVLIPILATLLGVLGTYLASLSGSLTINPIWGVLLGAAGVGVREIKDQLFPASTSSEPPPIAGSSIGQKLGLILAVSLASMLFVGCNLTPQTAAFNTIGSLESGVTGAYDGYIQAILAKQVTTNSLPLVSQSFNQFQSDALLATIVLNNNTNALAPTALIDESAALLNVITTANQIKK